MCKNGFGAKLEDVPSSIPVISCSTFGLDTVFCQCVPQIVCSHEWFSLSHWKTAVGPDDFCLFCDHGIADGID